jgi:hypothetical protein
MKNDQPPTYDESMKSINKEFKNIPTLIVSNADDEIEVSKHPTSVEDYAEEENNQCEASSDNPELEYELEQAHYMKIRLEKKYPIKYILMHNLIMTALNLAIIFLQLIAIHKNAALSYTGSGILAGIYNLITVALSLSTSKFVKRDNIIGNVEKFHFFLFLFFFFFFKSFSLNLSQMQK